MGDEWTGNKAHFRCEIHVKYPLDILKGRGFERHEVKWEECEINWV
jgi:hypothetical protein